MKIVIIAGEASGDMLGADLIRNLQNYYPEAEFSGIGGEEMQKAGCHNIIHVEQISVMGILEVIPHIPRLLGYIRRMADYILSISPQIVITIDAPDFTNRIVRKIKGKFAGRIIHYVAPTVWAYRPGRAEKYAKLYDGLMCLFPFEPAYFTKYGLKAAYVGHPLVFKYRGERKEKEKLILLLPGSRAGEIKRHLPIFLAAIESFQQEDYQIAIIVPSHLRNLVKKYSREIQLFSQEDKDELYQKASFALTKAGTITLELALASVPMVVAHKINPITAWMAKRLLKIQHVSLVNIIARQEIVPEFLQENCKIELLQKACYDLLGCQQELSLVRDKLGNIKEGGAASFVQEIISKGSYGN